VSLASLLFAFRAYKYAADFLDKHATSLGVWTVPLAFVGSYFIAWLILSALANAFIRHAPKEAHTNVFNKTLGILPGAIYGLINAAIVSVILTVAPIFDSLSASARESKIANALTPPIAWAEEKLSPVFDEAINHTINTLTVNPTSEKSIDLSFSVKDPKPRPDLEAEMLNMVNKERREQGLPILAPDPELREVARAHSRDMLARSYFSHNTPEGKTVADRARRAKVRYLTIGENLALAPTLKMAHTGLMNSPGHRANILRNTFARVGIGILDGGRYGIMVTQNFRN
jgi:uncharacterized protein YkwD